MGEAKRREPDKTKRIAQGIEKEKIRAAEREAEIERRRVEREEYLKANPPKKRDVNVGTCFGRKNLMFTAAIASSLMALNYKGDL